MDKKPLIVVSICAVVLLVLGSLSNVVAYQINQKTQDITIEGKQIKISTPTKIEGLRFIDIWLHFDARDWGYWLGISVQNIGTETIHRIDADGEWNFVFFHHKFFSLQHLITDGHGLHGQKSKIFNIQH